MRNLHNSSQKIIKKTNHFKPPKIEGTKIGVKSVNALICSWVSHTKEDQESNNTILLLQVSYKPIAIYKFSSNVRSYYYKQNNEASNAAEQDQ
jgi:hypothetical protein